MPGNGPLTHAGIDEDTSQVLATIVAIYIARHNRRTTTRVEDEFVKFLSLGECNEICSKVDLPGILEGYRNVNVITRTERGHIFSPRLFIELPVPAP
ncbi:hypothetical protein V1478_003142 [Vespula squamosa]|uniref:LAGLIDADG homing endonuclease n=1 Tax=Vespula squamosa TaxID=30214 RepID=A0ABD2BRU9_VESSQ